MSNIRTTYRSVFAAVAMLSTLAACGDDGAVEPNPVAGTYSATTFRVTRPAASEINVLEQGGNLTIVIGTNNATTGTLNLPPVVTGSQALQASMAGTIERNGNGVSFEQNADTFVRALNWTVVGNTITATSQSVGGATWTVVLTR